MERQGRARWPVPWARVLGHLRRPDTEDEPRKEERGQAGGLLAGAEESPPGLWAVHSGVRVERQPARWQRQCAQPFPQLPESRKAEPFGKQRWAAAWPCGILISDRMLPRGHGAPGTSVADRRAHGTHPPPCLAQGPEEEDPNAPAHRGCSPCGFHTGDPTRGPPGDTASIHGSRFPSAPRPHAPAGFPLGLPAPQPDTSALCSSFAS